MALEAIQIDAGYGRMPVVRGVSFAVSAGTLTALVGPNGAGKTTLLRCLLGTLLPQAGRVELDGVPPARIPVRTRAARLAFIPQAGGEGRSYSALQAVRLGRLAFHEPESRTLAMARAALGEVELTDRSDAPLGTLSVGQQQRVLLARALAQLGLPPEFPVEPRLAGEGAEPGPGALSAGRPAPPPPGGRYLLADEPIASLDPRHALLAMNLLRSAASRGVGVMVVMHDFALAARFSDQTLLLDGAGRVAAWGPTPEVLTPENLGRVFAIRFHTAEDSFDGARFPMPVGSVGAGAGSTERT